MELTTTVPARPAAAPAIPARMSDRTHTVLADDTPLLRELAGALGGPFHVLLPERFDENLAAFRDVAAGYGVDLRVHYAKKANKAAAWVRRCADLGAGVDVASAGELRDVLGQGVRGSAAVVTGPAKSAELLRLAVLHGALVAVDALDELSRLTGLAASLPAGTGPARILLRARPAGEPTSRFGLTPDELDDAVAHCGRVPDRIGLEGFSVHVGGYDASTRGAELARLAARCVAARGHGLDPRAVSIGGGFPVDYVDAPAWAGFVDDPAHFHAGRRFDGFYPYHSDRPGPETLRDVLDHPVAGSGTTADLLRAEGITVLVEPGRALLDQAGFTVFAVQGVKDRDGYAIVTVDGTSLSLSEQWFGSEFLPDPVLVPARRDRPDAAPSPACVGGASCLETDMLTWRKVPMARRPETGDLIVYPNTAGYQMDSNESEFHELPLPPKIVLHRPGSSPRWEFDRHPGRRTS